MSALQELWTNSTGAQDRTEVLEAARWIQVVVALLSVLGSGSIIVCLMLQRLGRTPELQLLPLFLLSVSDLLLALCCLIGAAVLPQHCSSNTHCYQLQAVEQVLYTASFFYTLNYVWNLYTGIREKYYSCSNGYPVQFSNRMSTAGKTTALLSGLFPVMLMTPVFIQGNISQCQANFTEPYSHRPTHSGVLFLTSELQQPIRACRLLHIYRIAVFLAAFFLTLLSIIVLVVKARRIYRRVVTSNGYLGSQQRASFRVMDRRMLLYPLIFILCWGPVAALVCVQVAKPSVGQSEAGVALYLSQAFTSASQGFLNCLVYGWTRARLCRVGGRVSSRDADTQTPLLRSQKKRSYQTLRTVG